MAIIVNNAVVSITTVDMIARSMHLINAVAAGEIPNDVDLNDALVTLNEMLDSWNLQPLTVYGVPAESWTLTAGQAVYNWGATAGVTGFNSDRPVRINKIVRVNGKQTNIERADYINSFPLGQLTFSPTPSEAVTLEFHVDRMLAGPLNLQAAMTFPPGYLRAIRYNLAVELWPEYANASTDIGSIKKIAVESLGRIKVANQEIVAATFEDVPNSGINEIWNWRID